MSNLLLQLFIVKLWDSFTVNNELNIKSKNLGNFMFDFPLEFII